MKQIIQCSLAHSSLVLATLAVGCADSRMVDIGDGHEPTAVLGASLTDYAGVWDGYAEAFTWNDGTDHVRITLDENGVGTLEVGEAEPFPPPDPDHGYPPGNDDPYAQLVVANVPLLLSGFGYPVAGAVVEDSRIRFSTATRSLYQEWCEMQPSYLDFGASPTQYACAPGFGWSVPEGNEPRVCTAYNGRDSSNEENAEVVDCGVGGTCLTRCECTESSCGVTLTEDTQIDASLEDEGETLEGTLLVGTLRVAVRMTRM